MGQCAASPNTCFLGPTWVQIPNGISTDSAIFVQNVIHSTMGHPFPSKLPLPMGDLDPYLIHDSLGPSEPRSQTVSRSVQLFLHSSPQCPYTSQWDTPFPSKLPLPMGGSAPHLIILIHGSLGPPASSTQTESQSVQPFLQGSLV